MLFEENEVPEDSISVVTNSIHADAPELIATKSGSTEDDDFVAENVGWPSKVPCGVWKCFYRLETNRQVGYLVAKRIKRKQMKAGWRFAKQLERDYGIHHFLLGPPTDTKVSTELAKRLNQNLYIEKYRKRKKKANRFQKGSVIVTEKVKLAPKRHLLLGCVVSKVRGVKRDLGKFLPYVKDKDAFIQSFRENLAAVRSLLNDEPCLINDFQAMIDPAGILYHLDFDRCFKSSGSKFQTSKKFTKTCFRALDKIEHLILSGAKR